jgi:hypothetical protein
MAVANPNTSLVQIVGLECFRVRATENYNARLRGLNGMICTTEARQHCLIHRCMPLAVWLEQEMENEFVDVVETKTAWSKVRNWPQIIATPRAWLWL